MDRLACRVQNGFAYISAAFAKMVGRLGSGGTVPHVPTFDLSGMGLLGELNFLHGSSRLQGQMSRSKVGGA